MTDNSKFLAGLLLGAAAGAAIGYLLTTDKGKEIVEEIKSAAGAAGDEVKSALEKGRKWASEFEEKASSSFNT